MYKFLPVSQIVSRLHSRFSSLLSHERANSLPNKANNYKLNALKDRHKGRRAVIIGNGPSLSVADLDQLKDEITFASNKIYLAFENTEWRPTYLTVTDTVVAANIDGYLRETNLCKVFGHGPFQQLHDTQDIVFGNPPSSVTNPFDWDIISGVSTGHSVLYWDLELAFWMGIREVYAIGLDFSFDVESKPTGEKAMGNDVLVAAGEVNHFHPDYRPKGEIWTMPQMDEQRKDFTFALEKYKSDNGMIYNASRKTKLDVWPRVSFETVFGPSQ